MTLTWADVLARYQPGDTLRPLVGGSKLTVHSVDAAQLCIRQRLWTACLTRADFETAVMVLERDPEVTPMEFAERLRVHYASGSDVITDCSRIPNLSAVLLTDLGAIDADRSRPRR